MTKQTNMLETKEKKETQATTNDKSKKTKTNIEILEAQTNPKTKQ
jgi:hypothetical protein